MCLLLWKTSQPCENEYLLDLFCNRTNRISGLVRFQLGSVFDCLFLSENWFDSDFDWCFAYPHPPPLVYKPVLCDNSDRRGWLLIKRSFSTRSSFLSLPELEKMQVYKTKRTCTSLLMLNRYKISMNSVDYVLKGKFF